MPEVETEKSKEGPGFSWAGRSNNAWGNSGGNVWGSNTNPTATPSLADVMSEELADQLQKSELDNFASVNPDNENNKVDDCPPEPEPDLDLDTGDDLMIARMLQKQFDKEYDMELGKEENQVNGSSKVRLSYSKYRMVPDELLGFDDSDEEEEDDYFTKDDSKRDWDQFETKEKELGDMPRCGYKKIGEKMVTKHDKEINQRENAKRMMEFPPGIQTGDGGGFDMQVSNQVYNKIRNFSVKTGKRKNRILDKEDKAVAEQAVDPQTRLLLFKLVNGGVLDAINGVISTGKEAVIMHANGGPGPEDGPEEPLNVPKECAIKVFKTTLNEFKTRDKYIRDDYRFKDRFSKQNPRKIIHMWAEKELHNLVKMAKGGIRVPDVVLLKKHVLVMSFIGADGRPAPKLKDAADKMSGKDLQSAYDQIVDMMAQMYNVSHLVHADLSEYNILWWDKECWIIDVSQAVEPIHPSGLDFLFRDCTNMYNFFSKRGLDVLTARELFIKVSGLDISEGSEAELLSQIRTYQKNQAVTAAKKDDSEDSFSFDYCWAKSQENDQGGRPIPSIPGHSKPRPGQLAGKSPKSPRSPKSIDYSKSPKSPVSDIVGMADEDLQKLKLNLLTSPSENPTEIVQPRKPTQIKFSDSQQFTTVDPDADNVSLTEESS